MTDAKDSESFLLLYKFLMGPPVYWCCQQNYNAASGNIQLVGGPMT